MSFDWSRLITDESVSVRKQLLRDEVVEFIKRMYSAWEIVRSGI
jgi:hypothetical protein